jgi:hypothetical protein
MKSFQSLFAGSGKACRNFFKGEKSMGLLELVQILMIILKLCNVLPLAWPWVFAPAIVWVGLKLLGKI